MLACEYSIILRIGWTMTQTIRPRDRLSKLGFLRESSGDTMHLTLYTVVLIEDVGKLRTDGDYDEVLAAVRTALLDARKRINDALDFSYMCAAAGKNITEELMKRPMNNDTDS